MITRKTLKKIIILLKEPPLPPNTFTLEKSLVRPPYGGVPDPVINCEKLDENFKFEVKFTLAWDQYPGKFHSKTIKYSGTIYILLELYNQFC